MIELVSKIKCHDSRLNLIRFHGKVLLHMAGRSYSGNGLPSIIKVKMNAATYRSTKSQESDEDLVIMEQASHTNSYDSYDNVSIAKSSSPTGNMSDATTRRIMNRYRQVSTDSAVMPLVDGV